MNIFEGSKRYDAAKFRCEASLLRIYRSMNRLKYVRCPNEEKIIVLVVKTLKMESDLILRLF